MIPASHSSQRSALVVLCRTCTYGQERMFDRKRSPQSSRAQRREKKFSLVEKATIRRCTRIPRDDFQKKCIKDINNDIHKKFYDEWCVREAARPLHPQPSMMGEEWIKRRLYEEEDLLPYEFERRMQVREVYDSLHKYDKQWRTREAPRSNIPMVNQW